MSTKTNWRKMIDWILNLDIKQVPNVNKTIWHGTQRTEEKLMMRVPQMKIVNCDDSKKKKEYK